MNKESLTSEVLLICQNVQCGAKLAGEINYHYPYNDGSEDILLFDKILKQWPQLKYFVNYHSDKQARKDGYKSIYIYKYKLVNKLIEEIELVKDKNSMLYHFALGKLYGYNDYEVMNFIKSYCK